jgi:membrane fusion protein, multidrug efflux system
MTRQTERFDDENDGRMVQTLLTRILSVTKEVAMDGREVDSNFIAPSLASPGSRQQRSKRVGDTRQGAVRRHPIALVLGSLGVILAAATGYVYWDHYRRFEATDDAFIAARQFAIAAKVPGYLTAVPVTDNQHLPAGGIVARIDDRDYHNVLAQAQAQVNMAQANIENVDAQISVLQAQIAAYQAQLQQSQAKLTFAQQSAARYQTLGREGWSSRQTEDLATSQLSQQQAAVASAQASLTAAQRQFEALKAQRNGAVASLAQAKAQRAQAELNLSYTTVTAAQPGRAAQLTAAVGQLAQPGTNLTMFVPDDIWVVANFKETQLDRMRPGQTVTLSIDAYPERVIRGHVASVQPGSGTAFSLLPAENATGNYVKIVQRVPVKIIVDNLPTDVALGPGMSVEPAVRVDTRPSLYEHLRAWL